MSTELIAQYQDWQPQQQEGDIIVIIVIIIIAVINIGSRCCDVANYRICPNFHIDDDVDEFLHDDD